MPGLVSDHQVVSPSSVVEAVEFLATHRGEGWQPLAGGTDLLVGINHHKDSRSRWLNVWKLRDELSVIEQDGELVRVGGLTTMTELRRSALLSKTCPMLGEAAATVGAAQIQNRATIAGNIVNASPAGDTLPVWLTLDAEIELSSAGGTRRVPYADFATGYRSTLRTDEELLTAVLFKPMAGDGLRFCFRKVGTRAAQAISKVVMAAVTRVDAAGNFSDVRLAFGSMAATTVRCPAVERAAVGSPASAETAARAAALLAQDLTPIDDVRSTGAYRMSAAQNLVRAFLAGHIGKA